MQIGKIAFSNIPFNEVPEIFGQKAVPMPEPDLNAHLDSVRPYIRKRVKLESYINKCLNECADKLNSENVESRAWLLGQFQTLKNIKRKMEEYDT